MDLFQEVLERVHLFLCPKEVEMFKRMEKLFDYIEFCDLNKLDKVQTQEIECDGMAETAKLYFQSNLGQVQIKLIKQFNNVYKMEYANYAGTTVFELSTSKYWVDVAPLLGETLKAKDVDLAIYELEQYLYNNLGDIENIIGNKASMLDERMRKHKEQLKILETIK